MPVKYLKLGGRCLAQHASKDAEALQNWGWHLVATLASRIYKKKTKPGSGYQYSWNNSKNLELIQINTTANQAVTILSHTQTIKTIPALLLYGKLATQNQISHIWIPIHLLLVWPVESDIWWSHMAPGQWGCKQASAVNLLQFFWEVDQNPWGLCNSYPILLHMDVSWMFQIYP